MKRDQLIQEFWHRGLLDYKLHAGQKFIKKALHKALGQLYVCNCARQWGKSFLMVTEAVSLAIRQPNSRIKYGTPFLTDLEEFIQPIFAKVLEDCPAELMPTFKRTGSKWVFRNGSELKLVGLDKNPNGLRGNTLDMIVIDECGFVSKLASLYRNVIIPATTHRPNCKIILISTPPDTPAHDFGDFIQRAQAEGCYSEFDIYSNPRVDEVTRARLMKESGGETSTTWLREYLCQLVTDADSQLVGEWDDKYIEAFEPDEFYPFYHLYEGMDLGTKDFTLCLFGHYDFKRAKLVIQDEVRLNGPTLTTLVLRDAIQGKEKELWGERKVYRRISDNNNPHLIQDLAILHRLSFMETDKESLEAMLNEVRMMVAAGRIQVDPKCTQLIGCLKYGVWDSKKKGFARSSGFGHFDALAALIYLVRNLDKSVNPIPTTYGYDVRNTIFRKPTQNQSEGARLLGQIMFKPTRKF